MAHPRRCSFRSKARRSGICTNRAPASVAFAIAEASGEILVFLDDDLVVARSYLAAVEQFFDTHREFAAMKGRILPDEDPEKKVGQLAPYMDLPIVDHGDEVLEVRGVLGANMAFRADALRQVGPFDERLGPGAAGHEEETEMSQRLRRAGFRIGYAPKALVYTEVIPSRRNRARGGSPRSSARNVRRPRPLKVHPPLVPACPS